MKEKIPIKTFYLIAVIGVGLLGLAIGSTYAVFTATATIENPISFTSNLLYNSETLESVDVTLAVGETKTITLNVVNSQTRNLKFASWYMCDSEDVEVVATPAEGYSLSGTIAKSSQFAITVKIRNHGSSTAFVNLGVSSTISSGEIVLSSDMKLLEEGELTTLLSDFDYAIGSYDVHDINIPDGDILLVRYKGTDTSLNIPATYTVDGVTYNTVMYSGTSNDDSVFMGNSSITKINFKDGVKFADFDFEDHTSLNYNSINYLFQECSSLTEITGLPDTITSMNGAFCDCTSLVNAPIIPSSVTSMESTFSDCTSLVTAPTIPNSVINMNFTFSGCTGLTTAPVIPSSVTNMYGTFQGCTNLIGNVNIESSNVNNASYVFTDTTKEINVYVPEGSITYTTFRALTTSNGMPSNVILNDEVFYTVQILVDGGNAHTETVTVSAGESYTTTFATMTNDLTVSCTNGQVANFEVNSSYVATFTIDSVTADTVCTVDWN